MGGGGGWDVEDDDMTSQVKITRSLLFLELSTPYFLTTTIKMRTVEEVLNDHYGMEDFERIWWRLRAGGWAKRQLLAGGVSFRECCELITIGCLCERCMLTLMRDEARAMVRIWEKKLNDCLARELSEEVNERRRLAAERIEAERPRRRRVANVVETTIVSSSDGTDTSEEESGGGQ